MLRIQASRTLVLAILALAAACSTGRGIRPLNRQTDQYLIEGRELEGMQRHVNLYDAVRELRPFWFSRHVRSVDDIAVYLDGQRIGNATALQRFPVTTSVNLRYLSPTEAQVRFGPNNRMMPVISIETPRRSEF